MSRKEQADDVVNDICGRLVESIFISSDGSFIFIAQAEAYLRSSKIDRFIAMLDQCKSYYYQDKVGVGMENKKQNGHMMRSYIISTQWTISYYYQGIPSWHWYYEYPHAPKILDLNIARFGLEDIARLQGHAFTNEEAAMNRLDTCYKYSFDEDLANLDAAKAPVYSSSLPSVFPDANSTITVGFPSKFIFVIEQKREMKNQWFEAKAYYKQFEFLVTGCLCGKVGSMNIDAVLGASLGKSQDHEAYWRLYVPTVPVPFVQYTRLL